MSSAEEKKSAEAAAAVADVTETTSAVEKPADDAAAPATAEEVVEEVIMLRCCDGEEFAVAVSVAKKCGTLRNMIDDDCVEDGVPLPNVKAAAMARVLEYLNSRAAATAAEEEAKEFDEKAFFDKMTKEALFDVILAANYLHAEELLGAAVDCAGNRIKRKSVEELREYFGLVNDFTPEEEEEIRRENFWAFD